MKNFTILCGTLLILCQAQAQDADKRDQLPESLKIEQFQTELFKIKQEKPSKHDLLSAYIANGVQIVHLPNAKIKAETIAEIPLRDKTQKISVSDFLYYAQNFELNPYVFVWRPQSQKQMYRLEGTDYYVYIPSQSELK